MLFERINMIAKIICSILMLIYVIIMRANDSHKFSKDKTIYLFSTSYEILHYLKGTFAGEIIKTLMDAVIFVIGTLIVWILLHAVDKLEHFLGKPYIKPKPKIE